MKAQKQVCIWKGKADLRVPNTVRRAEAESSSISDLTVHVYVPSSPSFTLEMLRKSVSFFSLRHKHSGRSHSPLQKPLPPGGVVPLWDRATVTYFKDGSDTLWSLLPPPLIKRLIILSPSHSDGQAGIRLHLTVEASCGASDGWPRLWDPDYTSRFWVTLTWNTNTRGAVRMEEV